VLPVARAQANIYAWLFKRQRWVVEIFSCEDLKLYRWKGEADYGDVERTLKGFKKGTYLIERGAAEEVLTALKKWI
jgi:hypothetical protein